MEKLMWEENICLDETDLFLQNITSAAISDKLIN